MDDAEGRGEAEGDRAAHDIEGVHVDLTDWLAAAQVLLCELFRAHGLDVG